MDLKLELPDSPLEAVIANEVWDELHQRLVALIREHRTTLHLRQHASAGRAYDAQPEPDG